MFVCLCVIPLFGHLDHLGMDPFLITKRLSNTNIITSLTTMHFMFLYNCISPILEQTLTLLCVVYVQYPYLSLGFKAQVIVFCFPIQTNTWRVFVYVYSHSHAYIMGGTYNELPNSSCVLFISWKSNTFKISNIVSSDWWLSGCCFRENSMSLNCTSPLVALISNLSLL